MQQLPRAVLDRHEDVKLAKRRCDRDEKVAGDNRLRVVA
jgi:hypothetical protein